MSQNKFLSVFIEKKKTLIESTDWGTYKIYFKCQFSHSGGKCRGV